MEKGQTRNNFSKEEGEERKRNIIREETTELKTWPLAEKDQSDETNEEKEEWAGDGEGCVKQELRDALMTRRAGQWKGAVEEGRGAYSITPGKKGAKGEEKKEECRRSLEQKENYSRRVIKKNRGADSGVSHVKSPAPSENDIEKQQPSSQCIHLVQKWV